MPRTRLLCRLDEGRYGSLILVTAPAGFGKTTLIHRVDRLHGARRAGGMGGAWVSLDAGDNDPARFWSYVVAAIQTSLGRDVGEASLALLGGLRPPSEQAS